MCKTNHPIFKVFIFIHCYDSGFEYADLNEIFCYVEIFHFHFFFSFSYKSVILKLSAAAQKYAARDFKVCHEKLNISKVVRKYLKFALKFDFTVTRRKFFMTMCAADFFKISKCAMSQKS